MANFYGGAPIFYTLPSIFPYFYINLDFLGDFPRFYAEFEKVTLKNGAFMDERMKRCDQNWSIFTVGPPF